MNKRILSVLLVALMAVALVVGAISVSAAGDPSGSFGWDSQNVTSIEDAARAHKDIYLRANYTADVKLGHTISIDLNGWIFTSEKISIYDADKTTKDVTVSFTNSEGANNKLDIPNVVVNNTNSYTQNGKSYPAYSLVVDSVTIGEINLKGTSTATLNNIPQVYDKATDKYVTTTDVVLEDKSVVTVNGGFVDAITDTDNHSSTVYVKGGYVASITGVDKVVVSGGEVGTITNVDTVEVTGGKVGTMSYVDDATVNGGDVDNVGDYVDLVLLKGTVGNIVPEVTTYDPHTTVVVKSAEIAGHVDENGKSVEAQQARIDGKIGPKANVTIIRGYVSDTKDNGVDRMLACAAEYGTVALYHDAYVVVDGAKKTLAAQTEYVFGEKLIEKHVLDSYVNYADAPSGIKHTAYDFVVIYANSHCDIALTATGTNNWVFTDVEYPLKDADITVNGLKFGSDLQPGAVIDHSFLYDYTYHYSLALGDDFTSGKNTYSGQPAHKWATELTKKTELGTVTCDKERVLQDYFADTLNPGKFFAKPDENGKIERQYQTSVEKDGPIFGSGHILTYHPAVAAAEGKDGNEAYYTCDNCNKFFSKDIVVLALKGEYGVKASEEYEIPGVPTIKADPKETKAPEETTKAPEETTKAPEETTKAPEETTKAPETQAPTPVNPSETGDNGMNALVWVIVLGAAVTGVAVAGKSVLASKKH